VCYFFIFLYLDEEQRLLLLLWNAKNKLFVQATHIQAKKQPLINSQTIGRRLGTRGKEKIFQALRDLKPAVVKAINRYNKQYKEYTSKFPQNTPSDPSLFPLTYEVFSAFPLDHTFWNNGLYYQSKEPWAVDPNVRLGINCVLILCQIKEEFQLIAQELAGMVEWAIDCFDLLSKKIDYLQERVFTSFYQ
jgi:hypothetical protein